MISITDEVIQNSTQASVLRLTNYNETVSGYYWCMVQSADHETPNPSQVININICPFTGNIGQGDECKTQVDLFESPEPSRCADHPLNIGKIVMVQLQPTETCPINNLETSTSADTTLNQSSISESTSSVFPMHYVWMIVGIAFVLLITVIIVMLIAIVCLKRKKNKIRGTAYYT